MTAGDLRSLAAGWLASGKRVFAPRRVKPGLVQYAYLKSADDLLLEGYVRPANSIKETVLPRHEVLYRYKINGSAIELIDEPPSAPETIVLAARPCDAAALPALDAVMNWDFQDDFYNRRREATTVVSLACTSPDENCFCEHVGLAPDADRGADALLRAGVGGYSVQCFTDKGAALFNAPIEPRRPYTPPKFNVSPFGDAVWANAGEGCLGCGSCAYTCPACHCFDIIDERGARVRNWDACQFGLFTLHASGHNPRHNQPQRQRQRVLHKFRIYPDKFGELLCTGCGNCTRNCPVGLGVRPVLEAVTHA